MELSILKTRRYPKFVGFNASTIYQKAIDRMSQSCRAIALGEYTLELQAQRYIELYRQILEK
jgi:hypothetical protein